MGCAFSQESEDSRYRRKIQQKGIQNNRNRSPHQRPQQRQSQPNTPAGRTGTPNNVYGPVVAKTATVNTRGSRTVTPVSVPPAAPAKTSPAAGSSSATDGGGTPAKASEPEDIHFRRQHFDRNSVLRHSKKRSRKASSPYATAASNAKGEGGGGKSKEDAGGGGGSGGPKEEKAEVGNNSSSSNTSIKENSSAVANRSSVIPKRNATTISISDDGSSRVITNGEEPSPRGGDSANDKDQSKVSSVSTPSNAEDSRLNKQQISSFSPQRRRTSDVTRPRKSSTQFDAPRKTSYESTNCSFVTNPPSTSPGTRGFRASELGRTAATPTTATTRQGNSSRNEQGSRQNDAIMAEDKSDECGRLI